MKNTVMFFLCAALLCFTDISWAAPPAIDFNPSVRVYSTSIEVLSEVEAGQQVYLTIIFTPVGDLGLPAWVLRGKDLLFEYRLQGGVSYQYTSTMAITPSTLSTSYQTISYTIPDDANGSFRFIGQVRIQGVQGANNPGLNDYKISHNLANDHDMIGVVSSCSSCHSVGADIWDDLFFLHRSDCSTCHDSTNQSVQDAITAGQAGALLDCQSCHGIDLANTHHSGPEAQNGDCSWCHADPRETWYADTPGDNGGSGPRPTQLACLECHLSFNSDYSIDISLTPESAVQHSLSDISAAYIDNYGICLSCHDGSNAVAVAPFHATPTSLSSSNRCIASGAPGRGTFNLFYGQFNQASARKNKGCKNYNGDYQSPAPGYDYLITIPYGNASVPVFPAIDGGSGY